MVIFNSFNPPDRRNFANGVDLDQMAHNKQPHYDLHSLPFILNSIYFYLFIFFFLNFVFNFCLFSLFETMGLLKSIDGRGYSWLQGLMAFQNRFI